jgi:hypothetical protein
MRYHREEQDGGDEDEILELAQILFLEGFDWAKLTGKRVFPAKISSLRNCYCFRLKFGDS